MIFYFLWLSIFLVLAILQAVFLRLNLSLLLILLLAIGSFSKRASGLYSRIFWLAFWAGFVFDLSNGLALGLSSLLYLGFCLAVFFYCQRFDAGHLFTLAGFVLFLMVIYQQLVFGNWNWLSVMILTLLTLVLRPLFVNLQTGGGFKWRY